MKTPIDNVKGKIVDIQPDGRILIECHYDDLGIMEKRQYKECLVQMIDSRKLSDKQRRSCYGMLREISEFTGEGIETSKEWLKIKFLADEFSELGDKIFSLSDAPMSLVCAFQRFLARLIIEWDIPCSKYMLEYVDDVQDYLYCCLEKKKCCICGQRAQLHHVDAVGSGRDRTQINHIGMRALPLCAEHHSEYHTGGKEKFLEKWHLEVDGIQLDKHLCKVYGLKTGGSSYVKQS